MTTKIRKQIYIETSQDALLKRMAEVLGVSEAEVIRQAINRQAQILRQPKLDQAAWEKERSFIVSLTVEPKPGSEAVRAWQRDDLYER